MLASFSSLALGAAISEVWVLRVPSHTEKNHTELERQRETDRGGEIDRDTYTEK